MSDNLVKHDFKNYKNSYTARRRRHVRLMAIIGAALMILGVVGSIFYYI